MMMRGLLTKAGFALAVALLAQGTSQADISIGRGAIERASSPKAQHQNDKSPRMVIQAGHTIDSFDFSPDRKTMVSGSHDKTVTLWDVARDKPQHGGKI